MIRLRQMFLYRVNEVHVSILPPGTVIGREVAGQKSKTGDNYYGTL